MMPGRRVASALQLRVTGTLGVLIDAKRAGYFGDSSATRPTPQPRLQTGGSYASYGIKNGRRVYGSILASAEGNKGTGYLSPVAIANGCVIDISAKRWVGPVEGIDLGKERCKIGAI